MSRRSLSAFVVVGAVGLAAALLPATSASAATAAAIEVSPTHGTPGAAISGTVTLTECEASSVSVVGDYIDVDGQEATTDAVAATATEGDPSTWTVALTVPADAARTSLSETPVSFTATAECADAPPAAPAASLRAKAAMPSAVATSGTAVVEVDDLAAAVLEVDPGNVAIGQAFSYRLTGCVGGVADMYLVDGEGSDVTIPESSVTSHPDATTYEGTFTVPADAVDGDGGVVADCAQAASTDAALLLFRSEIAETVGGGAGGGAAVPVVARPTFTG